MGDEKTRLASPPQTAHTIDSGALPTGEVTSTTPCSSHRYSYRATAQLADLGTCTPCLTWCGAPLDGLTSKSKILVGM